MKVVIFAGGLGTRLAEFTENIPKPLVKIGTMPIIWHIMKIYSQYGHNEFILPLGYKGELIKDFFLNLKYLESDFSIDTKNGEIEVHKKNSNNWKVTLIDTGLNTMTGGRLLKLKKYLNNERFFLTYGDGLSNLNINHLLNFHKENKKMVTVTAVRPAARFGEIQFSNLNSEVISFKEKPKVEDGWINGGFFVIEPELFEYLDNDETILEQKPLQLAARKGKLAAFKHKGLWQCMDNKKDYDYLNNLWENNNQFWINEKCSKNTKNHQIFKNMGNLNNFLSSENELSSSF